MNTAPLPSPPAEERPLGLFGALAGLFRTYALPPGALRLRRPFARDDRHCYLAQLPPDWKSEADGGSRVVLFEDGLPLGPAGAGHDDIRTLGRGRWSHWGPSLYFSSSDRTDPNRNGRSYAVLPPPGGSRRLPASTATLPPAAAPSGPDVADRAPSVTWQSTPLPADTIRPHAGLAWSAPVPESWISDDEDVSTLVLLEDGLPLGPAHALHEEIERHGGGRCSHWRGAVIFSVPDGTDPRTNGRRYTAVCAEAVSAAHLSAPIEPVADLMWRLPGLPARWSSDREGQSRLELLEDGRPLGPAHALHEEIRVLGGGRYSHWGRELFFSVPDGSDPRSNGRDYMLLVPD